MRKSFKSLTNNDLRSLKEGNSKQLVLDLSLFEIVSKGHLAQPEWSKHTNIDASSLEFQYLSESSHSIILSVVVLSQLILFGFHNISHGILNGIFNALKTKITHASKGLSSVFSDHTDSIN
jgi:hypothetical protein